jgi:hypothetical protein
MVKVLAIAVVRTGTELPEPITCSMGTELSSFGFFQRPVSHFRGKGVVRPVGRSVVVVVV